MDLFKIILETNKNNDVIPNQIHLLQKIASKRESLLISENLEKIQEDIKNGFNLSTIIIERIALNKLYR